MKLVIDPSDILFHLKQLPLPEMVRVQAVSFAPGGSILVDGAIKLSFLSLDAKIKLQAALSDGQTVRVRIVDVASNGVSLLPIVKRVIAGPALPGVQWVESEKDAYLQYKLPVDFLPLSGLATDGGVLTITTPGVDVVKMQAYLAASQKSALAASGSMADKARLAKLENKT